MILENEMDVILAHKQSMRLGELTGLSLAAQTTLATAISEVARSATGRENDASITLYVSDKKDKLKYITAVLEDKRAGFTELKDEGYKYAKRLVQHITTKNTPEGNRIELFYRIPPAFRIDDSVVEKLRINLNTDPDISPYEEIKRKNRQLVEMADRLRESEQQYKSLTDSLPIMIFTMTSDGKLTYMNQWLYDYSGQTIEEINNTKWEQMVHPDEFGEIWTRWDEYTADPTAVITPERRLKNAATGEYRWHTGVSIPIKNADGAVQSWNSFMVDIHAQKMIEEALRDNKVLKEIHAELEEKVMLLDQSNKQLEQFAYITSHDLQEPLRKIGFYSDFLNRKYGDALPKEAGQFFNNLINASERMKLLIQDVLAYSMMRKDEFSSIDLNDIAHEALQDLEISIGEKNAVINVEALPVISGNSRQLKQLFENIISNSLKYSRPDVSPQISISAEICNNNVQLSFIDNGIGFEQKYMHKMFDIFQRLHGREKYSGTGIGLAICKKIANMHNGTITATGNPGNGAIFMVTLPISQPDIQKNN